MARSPTHVTPMAILWFQSEDGMSDPETSGAATSAFA